MVLIYISVLSCVQLFTGVHTTPVQKLCPSGQFLDEVTGLCIPCKDLCELSATEPQCEMFCPDYQTPGKGISRQEEKDLCPKGTYLDETLRCESCSDLCSPVTKNKDCDTKCPGYLENMPDHWTVHTILWIIVVALGLIFVILVICILVKARIWRSRNRSQRRRYDLNTPFIVPYLKLDEEKPTHRVDRWLTLFHHNQCETDSGCESKPSPIYNPHKTKC